MPGKRVTDKRKKVLVFVSYASDDRSKALAFLKRFEQQTSASSRYRYIFWKDRDILVGTDWHEEIQGALAKSNLGLLLISPAFLGSPYITRSELPRFVGHKAKPVVPIMLQPIEPKLQSLKGLRSRQIFALDSKSFSRQKAFSECVGKARDEFALELFRRVELRLRQIFKPKRRSRSPGSPKSAA